MIDIPDREPMVDWVAMLNYLLKRRRKVEPLVYLDEGMRQNVRALIVHELQRLAEAIVEREKEHAKHYPKIEIVSTKSNKLRAKVIPSRSGIPFEVTLGGIKWHTELDEEMRDAIIRKASVFIENITREFYHARMMSVPDDGINCQHAWKRMLMHDDGVGTWCEKCEAAFTIKGNEMRFFPPGRPVNDQIITQI